MTHILIYMYLFYSNSLMLCLSSRLLQKQHAKIPSFFELGPHLRSPFSVCQNTPHQLIMLTSLLPVTNMSLFV